MISFAMAASRPKQSVKQSLNPDFVYEFPGLVSPTEIDVHSLPSKITVCYCYFFLLILLFKLFCFEEYILN